MSKAEKKQLDELSISDRLEQIIDLKKSENSALKKIADSLATATGQRKKEQNKK